MSGSESKPTTVDRRYTPFASLPGYSKEMVDEFIAYNPDGSALRDAFFIEAVGTSKQAQRDNLDGKVWSKAGGDLTALVDRFKTWKGESDKRKNAYKEYVDESRQRPGRSQTILVPQNNTTKVLG